MKQKRIKTKNRPGTNGYLRSFFAWVTVILVLAAPLWPVYAAQREILQFESSDTLEDIRHKIKHNGYRFTVDHNWVYDMSPAEKERFFSRRPPPSDMPMEAFEMDVGPLEEHLAASTTLPSSFDWRNHNGRSYIGPIRNQGNCGSCYAFGALAAAEGTYNYAFNRTGANCIDFSESYVIWCLGRLPEYKNHFFGCYGADYSYSELEALTVYGVTTEAHFPYTTKDPGACTHWGDPVTVFRSWHRVPCNNIDAIKTAIMTYGVVDAAVYVGSAFEAYRSGVYEDSRTSCNATPCYNATTNHAVALVGWNDNPPDGGGGYWILRNSYGTSWGESGYMRIRYTSARVACAVSYLTIQADSPTRIIRLGGDLAFGNVTVGQMATRTLTIHNDGNSTLTVSSITYPAGFGGNWSGGPISAGGSRNVTVTFVPTAVQAYGGSIAVNSDKTSGTNTRSCSGTGGSSGPVYLLYVSKNCGGRLYCYSTIQSAIDAALDGADIYVEEGVYAEDLLLNMPKSITITGGWNPEFTSHTPNSTFIRSPVVNQGAMIFKTVTMNP